MLGALRKPAWMSAMAALASALLVSLFAYGMPLDSLEGWNEVANGIQSLCGEDRLGLIHANDCKFERGSKRDRHEWIGDGHLGETGFAAMMCVPELAGVAVCVEMPGEVPQKDKVNIERLKSYRDRCET